MTIDGGTFAVPVEVNGSITLHFMVDSGASTITVPSDVVSTLMRMGSLKKSDFGQRKTYILADGSSTTSETFTIRSLRVGSAFVKNVEASIAPAVGPLLLGQSFLQRFRAWTIDNIKHEPLLANGHSE
jgi:clan AA aspartic protease (TIGR02281 family)